MHKDQSNGLQNNNAINNDKGALKNKDELFSEIKSCKEHKSTLISSFY